MTDVAEGGAPDAAEPTRGSRVRWIGLAFLLGLAGMLALGTPWHLQMQLAWFDAYQKIAPREASSLPAVIVAIDEKSLAELGQWPWPRTTLARLVAAINSQRPAAIGLDLLFPEADRMSPARIADALSGADDSLRERLRALPENDARFAAAIAAAPVVLGIAGTPDANAAPLRVPPFRVSGREPGPRTREFPGVLTSLDLLDRAAAGHGLLSSDLEGGVVRRMPLVARVRATLAPGFTLELLRVASGSPHINLVADGARVRAVGVGELMIQTDADGAVWIPFSRRVGQRFVSAADVLAGRLPPDTLTAKLVLVGATGIGLLDYQTAPTAERLPGVEVHAQVLEAIVDHALLLRPGWTVLVELAALMGAGLLLIWAIPVLSPPRGVAIAVTLLALFAGGAFVMYAGARVLVDAATPGLSLVVLFGAMLALSLAEAARRQRLLERQVQRQREDAARVAGELEAARRIQVGILPRAETLKREMRIEIAAAMTPAREVGGDLYDFFMLDGTRLFFLVGDVSGKGLPASIFMAVSKALWKSNVLRTHSGGDLQTQIGALMTSANEEVSRENSEMMFVTLFAGLLDLASGELAYCNAGHDNPCVLAATGGIKARLSGGDGPPLCVMDDFTYGGATHRLLPGEFVYMVTDGVTEAMNGAAELYGGERLHAALARPIGPADRADDLLERVRVDVAAFAGAAEPADDLTILVLRWRGADAGFGRVLER